MRKTKIGSIEVLGYIGIILWTAIVFLRQINFANNEAYLFLLGILPNAGAAWAFTMFIKFTIIFLLKRDYTIKIHLAGCSGIIFLAFISEVVHHLFLNSPFDPWDMLVTLLAQIIIFTVPLLINDKYFSNYY